MPSRPPSIEQQQYQVLEKILLTLQQGLSTLIGDSQAIMAGMHAQLTLLQQIVEALAPEIPLTGFEEITNMVPLAAGQTATFSTTPIPSNAQPDPTKIVWSSSDAAAFPLSPNTADASGLSVNLTFPANTAAGVSFTLTVSYVNSDGTTATQTDTFTTVAPPPVDVTGFTAITQTA